MENINNYFLLNELYEWYVINKNELLKQYENKYIVISDFKVIDSFYDENEAYWFGVNNIGLDYFILKHCTLIDEIYSIYNITTEIDNNKILN